MNDAVAGFCFRADKVEQCGPGHGFEPLFPLVTHVSEHALNEGDEVRLILECDV